MATNSEVWPTLEIDANGSIIHMTEAAGRVLAALDPPVKPSAGRACDPWLLGELRKAPALPSGLRCLRLLRRDGELGEIIAFVHPDQEGALAILVLESCWLDAADVHPQRIPDPCPADVSRPRKRPGFSAKR